jgi:hypothetical protein
MSLVQILLSTDFIFAMIIYALAICITLPLLSRFRTILNHPALQWKWDHIFVPLVNVLCMVLFILSAYPSIFGLHTAPSIITLLSGEEFRLNTLINILFLVSILFPLIPLIGSRQALILPGQAIASSMLVFSWLATDYGLEKISYWPGIGTALSIILLAILTYRLAKQASFMLGQKVDNRLHLVDSGELIARCLVLFMQSPAILIYAQGLGRQLN